jgi:pyruvate kinase
MEQLVKEGMNIARLNFSHGSLEVHRHYIHTLREIATATGTPLAILQDLPGKKPRIGRLSRKWVSLKNNARVRLTAREVPGDEQVVSIDPPILLQAVREGDAILLNEGAIHLRAVSVTATDIECQVVRGGVLKPRMGLTLPGVSVPGPALTEQDLNFLSFGVEHQVDLIALSFVDKAADVAEAKKLLNQKGADIPVIAKIERREAIDNLLEILHAADGIMVARGDLGLEMPLTQVPVLQKEIIRHCNRLGKPVITATQMLESMVRSPSPTRAEASDVANAVFDGSDALMLSAETSVGRYPVEATRMMRRIIEQAEMALPYERLLAEKEADLEPRTDDAISFAACHIAHQLGAAAIVAFTFSGSTAWRVSKYRPRVPVLALTPHPTTLKKLALAWGVYPVEVVEPPTVDGLLELGAKLARELGYASAGDLVVITAGIPLSVPGTTNLVKVTRIM